MTQTSTSNAPVNGKRKYFDVHITGIGYLRRIRLVKPKKGTPFLACQIAALNGPCDKPEYVYFDAKVAGRKAEALVQKCQPAVEAGSKVLLGFKLGDPWIDTYPRGEKKEEIGTCFKSRLLYIPWIKIDGVERYRDKPRAAAEGSDDVASVSPDSFQDNLPQSDLIADDTDASAAEAQAA